MRRYLHIWLAQLRYSISRELLFKGNFLMWVFVDFVWLAMQLIFIEVLYLKVDSVAGWSKWEMILLIGTANLAQQIFDAFLMTNCTNLPELIRTGKLDFYLAQPASAQFLVSTRYFNVSAVVNGAVAVSLVLLAVWKLGIALTPANLAAYLALLFCGVSVHYSLMLALVTASFWLTRNEGLIVAYFNLFRLSRLPRESFHGFFKVVFTWVLPMLLVANAPARVLTTGGSWFEALALLLMAALLVAASGAFFRLGLRSYTSASS